MVENSHFEKMTGLNEETLAYLIFGDSTMYEKQITDDISSPRVQSNPSDNLIENPTGALPVDTNLV